jgi:hypothetical protein
MRVRCTLEKLTIMNALVNFMGMSNHNLMAGVLRVLYDP